MKKIVHSIVVSFLTVLLASISWYAGASSSYIRTKSQPDVYQYSPDPLPQISLDTFYRQEFQQNVDPRTGHLVFSVEDFAIPQRDEVTLHLARHYDSGVDHQSILGKGWFFGFESRISVMSEQVIQLTDNEGKVHDFTKEIDNKYVSYANGRLEIIEEETFYALSLGTTELRFRKDGKLLQSVGKNGSSIDYIYEDGLLSKVDLFGRSAVLFEYTAENLLTRIVLPTGKAINYEYNEQNRLINVVNPIGQSIKYDYSEQGSLTSINYFDAAVVKLAYVNDSAIIESMTFPDGVKTSFDFTAYQEGSKKSSELTFSTQGRIEKVSVDGNKLKYINALNQESFVEYHERFTNLIAKTKSSNGQTISYEYTETGKIRSISK